MAARLNAPLRRVITLAEAPSLRIASRVPLRAATPILSRTFTSTNSLSKKRKVAAPSNSPIRSKDSSPVAPSSPQSSSSSSSSSSADASSADKPDPENPLDFSSLLSAWTPIDAHFKSQLHALLHGGRFNPETLASLPVIIKPPPIPGAAAAPEPETYPLGELAQVVPRSGRTISLLVNDKEYIKPIMSAVQASPDFNQQPQRAEDNDLELLLKVEIERKEDVLKRLKDITQTWRDRVRHARTKHEKHLKDWKKNKVVTADVGRKAEQELQKVQNKKMKEIDDEETKATKQLERNSS